MGNMKDFAIKEKTVKETLSAKKDEESQQKKADRSQETDERNADQSFLDTLTQDCEDKARLWDQRSSTRSDELRAFADALDTLRSGVKPNFESNKNLVTLQTGQK